jgi:hypothetical protein
MDDVDAGGRAVEVGPNFSSFSAPRRLHRTRACIDSSVRVFRQSEDIERIAISGVMNIRRDHTGHGARTPSAQPRSDGNVLPAANRK